MLRFKLRKRLKDLNFDFLDFKADVVGLLNTNNQSDNIKNNLKAEEQSAL